MCPILKLSAIAALALVTCQATAQRKPLTLVVSAAAGAANDLLARTLAAEVKDEFGAVIVENRPGANGTIGAELVKRSGNDGRTLLVTPSSYAILVAIGAKVPFDFVRDFDPVVYASNLPFYLVVNQEALPGSSVADIVRQIRAHPGKFSFGTAGSGSPHHFANEMFKQRAGLDMVHVPYKGMALGIPDLLEGRIQLTITGLPAVSAALKTGKLKVHATMDPRRTALTPDIPTFTELGYSGMEMETWLGLVAPAGSPKAAIDQANTAFNRALKLPHVREKLAAQGLEIVGGSPETFATRIREDIDRFRRVAQSAGIKPD
jgi:tripartite-type tricarboxylate transporter receptor subunit TctC